MKQNDLSITEETIQLLTSLVNGVVGFDISKSYTEKLNLSLNDKGKEIVFKYASFIEDSIGKTEAFSTLREVGKNLAIKLMKDNYKEEKEVLLERSLKELGFAQSIAKEPNNIFICNCVFYDILQINGIDPIEHAVCWVGWGFIEGFLKEMQNVNSITWKSRDIENERCNFVF